MAGHSTSVIKGKGQEVVEVKRRETTAPDTLPGTQEGRVKIACLAVTRNHLCGHLHESRDEAERCAEILVARLNSKPMPPDYYLG